MNIKNFLRGAGSILDIYPNGNNRICIPMPVILSDEEALKKDWEIIGNDIASANANAIEAQRAED